MKLPCPDDFELFLSRKQAIYPTSKRTAPYPKTVASSFKVRAKGVGLRSSVHVEVADVSDDGWGRNLDLVVLEDSSL